MDVKKITGKKYLAPVIGNLWKNSVQEKANENIPIVLSQDNLEITASGSSLEDRLFPHVKAEFTFENSHSIEGAYLKLDDLAASSGISFQNEVKATTNSLYFKNEWDVTTTSPAINSSMEHMYTATVKIAHPIKQHELLKLFPNTTISNTTVSETYCLLTDDIETHDPPMETRNIYVYQNQWTGSDLKKIEKEIKNFFSMFKNEIYVNMGDENGVYAHSSHADISGSVPNHQRNRTIHLTYEIGPVELFR